ncbi:MAG TPA: histidine kinase [Novosphingobium sp.]|nr:histidine kinase [Novosphingobium sp.]
MHKVIGAVAFAAAALTAATSAQAQGWGVWAGSQPQYYGGGGGGWAERAVCSGQRARGLESRLRHEEQEGEIDPGRADRIHDAIDRLEDRSRDECAEGDRHAIWGLARQFDRIQAWLENEAHGDWRRW